MMDLLFGILPELNLFDWNIQEVCNRGEPLTMAERPLLTEFLRCHVCSEIFQRPCVSSLQPQLL
uniref:Uncharacterized protein n=1 Tax=Anguilla anguilla TaxID=7936 RepID=A0A0E9Q8G3_ANGAN